MTLIDSDILIDAGRGVTEAVDCLKAIKKNDVAAISIMTQMELLVGAQNKVGQNKLDKFFKQFQIVKIDAAISDKSVELLRQYRLSHGLLIADSLIAATALALNVPLVSKNQRDYKFIVGLNLLPYP